MSLPAKIADKFFGKLKLVDESAYVSNVSWNRGLKIRVFVHIEGQNYGECIDNAKKTFLMVREQEGHIFKQGADRTRLGSYADDFFLNSDLETSIEIHANGSGTLLFTVMMAGSLIIEFTPDCTCDDARFLPGQWAVLDEFESGVPFNSLSRQEQINSVRN